MAITRVGSGSQKQTVTGNGVNSITVTYPANVAADSLLLLTFGGWANPANTSIGLTDTRSSSWNHRIAATGVAWSGGTGKPAIGWAVAPSAGACTVTINPNNSSDYFYAAIDEFTGQDTTTPLNVDGGETTGTGHPASETLSGVSNGDLVVGVVAMGNTWTSLSAGSGYTLLDSQPSTGIQPYASEFQIVAAGGTLSPDFGGVYTGVGWSMISASFKESGGVAPTGRIPKLVGVGGGLVGARGGLVG